MVITFADSKNPAFWSYEEGCQHLANHEDTSKLIGIQEKNQFKEVLDAKFQLGSQLLWSYLFISSTKRV